MMDTFMRSSAAGERLAERYREAAPTTGVWSPTVDVMLQHRSVRAYTDQPLAPGTLETLVAAAQSAATSSNLQTWSVVAIEDPARRARLAELAGGQRHIRQTPLFLVWIADLSRAERLAKQSGQTLEGTAYLEMFIVAIIDAALAAQNAAVAAESLGLGTVYIGAMRNKPEAVAAELGLPPAAMAAFGLCVGHEDEASPASIKPRLPQSVVLHREQYDTTDGAGAIPAYDQTLKAFQHEQAMTEQGWSDLILGRMGPVKSLTGRDRLQQAAQALGFPLR